MVLLRQLLRPPQNPQTTNQEGKRKQQEPDTKPEIKKGSERNVTSINHHKIRQAERMEKKDCMEKVKRQKWKH